MGRHTGPKCRLCRREGEKLFLKGKRCESAHCAFEGKNTRPYPPGVHGKQRQRVKFSTFGRGVREKQKFKRIYGIGERQFKIYFSDASKVKGNSADNLLVIIERRLDNVVFRLGLAHSRNHARQIVNHGHVFIAGKRVSIPSYLVNPGEKITVLDKDKIKELYKEVAQESRHRTVPSWLSFDIDTLTGHVETYPSIEDIQQPLKMHLIIEVASR